MRAKNWVYSIALSFVIALGGATRGMAEEGSDGLDSRLARLEAENATLKKRLRIEALERENASLKKQLGIADASRREAEPTIAEPLRKKTSQPEMLAYAKATPPRSAGLWQPTPTDTWSGFYWGSSFGVAKTRAQVNSNETYIDSNLQPPFSSLSGVSNVAQSTGSSTPGALIDFMTGVNAKMGSYLLAGLQLEGSLAEINFDSEGTRGYTYFDQNGFNGFTAAGPFHPYVHARWMISALGRLGVLTDPATLVYAIAGLTAADFEYGQVTNNTFFEPGDRFWARGWSVGGGVERKLGPNWSIRAEYRYTHFQDVTVTNNFVWTSVGPGSESQQANAIQDRFSNTMQVGRLGVAYLFPSSLP
jgi:outer membrane immunogenic protein